MFFPRGFLKIDGSEASSKLILVPHTAVGFGHHDHSLARYHPAAMAQHD